MEDHIEILKNFGLTDNDIFIYQSLVRLGRSKTGPIADEAGIVSSRVYASLQSLIKIGLVSYQVKNNVRYYQAELPYDLIDKAEKNIDELKRLSKKLEHSPILTKPRNDTNVYEGIRGLKMAYRQHIDAFEEGETAYVMAFVGPEFSDSKDLRQFFVEMVDRKLIEKKCKTHMITNKLINKIIKEDRPDRSWYDIRYVSPNYTLPYTLNISKREIMISVWGENSTVFSIKNPTVIAAFQKNFDFLWKKAKKI